MPKISLCLHEVIWNGGTEQLKPLQGKLAAVKSRQALTSFKNFCSLKTLSMIAAGALASDQPYLRANAGVAKRSSE